MIYSTQKEKEKIIKKRKNYKKSVNCSNPFYISVNWKAI